PGSGAGGDLMNGTSGYGTSGYGAGEVIIPVDMTGYVNQPALGVAGPWYVFSDGLGSNGAPPGDCEVSGHPVSECAAVTTPAPGAFPNVLGAMRTAGTVERIGNIPGMTGCPMTPVCDYQSQWGAGIGVHL